MRFFWASLEGAPFADPKSCAGREFRFGKDCPCFRGDQVEECYAGGQFVDTVE
jgi:hypothetical protein